MPLKTPQASLQLGVNYSHVMSLIRARKIPLPEKDSSGDFIWTAKDLENARRAIAAGRRKRGEAIAPRRSNAGVAGQRRRP